MSSDLDVKFPLRPRGAKTELTCDECGFRTPIRGMHARRPGWHRLETTTVLASRMPLREINLCPACSELTDTSLWARFLPTTVGVWCSMR